MFGVSKLASVLGVPGEQPRHNSRVEWAGECRGGKMNSMLWGFPAPHSLQGLRRRHCAGFPACDRGQRWKKCGFLTLGVGEKHGGRACNTYE